jgi:membrane fusion protein (multidrug efflux system)
VLVIGPDNKAELRAITADRTIGTNWLATAGLKPGDKVIVEGLGKIRTGQQVQPVPAGSPSQRGGKGANGGESKPG